MEHFEVGDPIRRKFFNTYAMMLNTISEYLKFNKCSKSIVFNLDFGNFPNGSYAKVYHSKNEKND